MGTIYKVTMRGAARFIRAASSAMARMRASEVWRTDPDAIEAMGVYLPPSFGAQGYDRAARTADVCPDVARTLARIARRRITKPQTRAGHCSILNPEYAALFAASEE